SMRDIGGSISNIPACIGVEDCGELVPALPDCSTDPLAGGAGPDDASSAFLGNISMPRVILSSCLFASSKAWSDLLPGLPSLINLGSSFDILHCSLLACAPIRTPSCLSHVTSSFAS